MEGTQYVPTMNPGKSTVYVSNLPYDLKPPDIQKIFERYGRIIKVTLLTVKETRQSKGVAFVLFYKPEDAEMCVYEANNSQLLGNVLKASIARDNGRRPNIFKNNPPNYNHNGNDDYDNAGYHHGPNYDNAGFENRPFHYKNPYFNNEPNYQNPSNSSFKGNVNYRFDPNGSWNPYN